MRRRSFGPAAWIIDRLDDPTGWAVALRQADPLHIIEIVPAHDTVVVRCEREFHAAVGAALDEVVATASPDGGGDPVVIDVRYDGADLGDVAEQVGMSVDGVIDLHVNTTYTAAFCGFSPGFTYLTGLDHRLQIPRRASPRTAVPAGAVAIAAEYSCVYPFGVTGRLAPPRLDRPRGVGPRPVASGDPDARPDGDVPASRVVSGEPTLRVVEPGWATTIQDHGRPGWAHLGVPTAGAVDRPSHDLVNRLVGNIASAATLETLGGLVVEALRPTIVARSNDGSRHTLATGERLRVDAASDALWAYLAVRGGVDVASVLGSRSRDTLSDIGPAPIVADSLIDVGTDPRTELTTEFAPVHTPDRAIRLWPGPHAAHFVGGLAALTVRRWTVTGDVSRVGARLAAHRFELVDRRATVRSIGLVPGAIQITPAGEPIVMLANHPTTGGYPVIAVVEPDDLSLVVQSPPGTILRFVAARPDRTSAGPAT